MSELPSSWATTPLLAVCELLRGVTYTKDVAASLPGPDRLPVLRANNLQGRAFDLSDLVYVPSDLVSQQQRILAGDVVVATSSGSISVVGKAVQSQRDMAAGFGAFCGMLRPVPALNSRYFGHFFSSEAYRTRVSALARGSNINNLKREHFESLLFPVAPPEEQQRIADKLDTVLARVDACRDRLARVGPLLKRFRQSVLAAATSGRLTEDWRGETSHLGDAPLGWIRSSIREVTTDIRYGTSKKCAYGATGPGVLRIPNIRGDGRIDSSDLKRADFSADEIDALALRPGDLLVIRSNGSVDLVGRTAVVSEDDAGFLFAGYLIRLRLATEKILSAYAYFCLSEPSQRATIELTAKSTSGVNNINSEELLGLPLLLPSKPEQAEIVRRVETLFAFADRLEARLAQAQTAVDRMTPSLLAKAFRGELVPQDPADEPAAELLKRLAASRAAPAPKTRKGRQVQTA